MYVSYTVKPVFSGHSKRRPKLVFKTDYRLMQVKSIAECSKGSILQYFLPSLSYHLSLRSLFCQLLSGRLRQVLLYVKVTVNEILFKPQETATLHSIWRYSDLIVELYIMIQKV